MTDAPDDDTATAEDTAAGTPGDTAGDGPVASPSPVTATAPPCAGSRAAAWLVAITLTFALLVGVAIGWGIGASTVGTHHEHDPGRHRAGAGHHGPFNATAGASGTDGPGHGAAGEGLDGVFDAIEASGLLEQLGTGEIDAEGLRSLLERLQDPGR